MFILVNGGSLRIKLKQEPILTVPILINVVLVVKSPATMVLVIWTIFVALTLTIFVAFTLTMFVATVLKHVMQMEIYYLILVHQYQV